MIKRLKLIKRQRNKRGDSKRAASATNANSNTRSMDHSHSEDQLWGAVEIIPQRLYYAPLKFFPPETEEEEEEEGNDDDGSSDSKSENKQQPSHHHHHPHEHQQRKRKKSIHYFSIDNELIYWNFFLDFGPLNLGQLYRFSSRLNAKLSSPEHKDDIICYYSGARGQQKANATFLICAWQMLYLGRSLEESWFGWRENNHDLEEEEEGDGTSGSLASDNRAGNTSLPPRQSRPKRSHDKSNNNESSSSGRSSGIHAAADDDDDRLGRHRLLDGLGKQQVPSPFARIHPLPPFHDASPIVCTYDLSVYDCLRGLDKARKFGFFKFGNAPPPGSDVVVGGGAIESSSSSSSSSAAATATSSSPPPSIPPVGTKPPRHPSNFDANEYEHFEQVENGDLNWIVQNKILAFAGPQDTKVITPEGFCMLTPSDYIPYFVKSNVELVVRLNKKCYDESEFENAGIRHVEHYYLDGSCPPLRILHAVVADMETLDEDAAMAVHCKAGLGRTGTCIGAYLMKHYRLTAGEVIGWMRICRPGMVIGPQQHFLADVEGLMWQEGEMMYGRPGRALPPPSTSVGESDELEEEVAAAAATAATFDTPSKPPSAAVVSPESAATTPDDNAAAAGVAVDVPSGAHAAIVTPDGKPLRIPPTPVVARKLDLGVKRDAAIMMDNMALISPKSSVAASGTSDDNGDRVLCSTPSSTGSLPNTLDALKVDSSSSSSSSSPNGPTTDGRQQQLLAKEGDQANALLLRRLDQYQARQNEKA